MTNGSAAQGLRFGIFDWIDEARPTPLAQQFEERLRMLEYADAAGFWCYHLAEHHGTPLSTVPSPHLFLAAASQRTRRLRLGPLVTLLPLYSPIRVIEEVCMLDHMTNGRLEFGVGRGVVPAEMAQYNVPGEKTRGMFLEALDIVLQGLRDGRVNYEGEFYRFANAMVTLRPLQKPYPPLWYPTSNPESVEWIASNGFNTIFGFTLPTLEQTLVQLGRYRQFYAQHQDNPNRLNGHVAEPIIGIARHVCIAETDEAAVADARPAYVAFRENFISRPPIPGQLTEAIYTAQRENWDEFVAQGGIFAGSAETVRGLIQHYIDATQTSYVVPIFAFGNLSIEKTLRSMKLFVDEVMPRLRPASATSAVR